MFSFHFLREVSVYLFFSSSGLRLPLTCLGKGSRALSVLFPESDTDLVCGRCGRSSRGNLWIDLCCSFCAQNKIPSFPWPTRLLAFLSNVVSEGAFSEDAEHVRSPGHFHAYGEQGHISVLHGHATLTGEETIERSGLRSQLWLWRKAFPYL